MKFASATSHHIEEVGAGYLLKDLRTSALVEGAMQPAFVHDPRREPAVYRDVLRPLSIGPRCLGVGPQCVLLERVDGVELWQVADLATWQGVARWLAGMHRRLSDAAGDTDDVPFLEYDQELMGAWRDRAAGAGVAPAVLAAHERVAPRLAASSRSVIHGEFYASNVLVQVTGSDELVEVWPVDWELAGRGPAVLDVAALTAGRWGATERAMMARAYFDAAGHDPASWPAWCADLDAARLHLCVQWLGWKPGWVPPPEHRHDWLAEAVVLMERL